MRIVFLILTLTTYSYARKISCHACINKVCYIRSKIIDGYKLSGQLAIDRTSNVIYFHYQNNSKDYTGAFDMIDVKLTLIKNLTFTFAYAVDQSSRNLYASGAKGIYVYNPTTNTTKLHGLEGITIWQMQYDNKLYYTEFLKKGLYIYENKKSKNILELSKYQIDDFIIDKRGDIYFMSNYAIYLLKNGAKNVTLFEDEIYFLATDNSKNAYFIQPYTKGIYKINYKDGKLIGVGAFDKDSPFKLVFDGDNHIIYYDAHNIKLFYLSPTSNKCSITTRGTGKHRKMFVARSRNYKGYKKTLKYNQNNTNVR